VELCATLRLRHVPDYTTVYCFLRWLDGAALERPLSAVLQRLVPPPDRQATVVVDATSSLSFGSTHTWTGDFHPPA
jgi:hypothetical protein